MNEDRIPFFYKSRSSVLSFVNVIKTAGTGWKLKNKTLAGKELKDFNASKNASSQLYTVPMNSCTKLKFSWLVYLVTMHYSNTSISLMT